MNFPICSTTTFAYILLTPPGKYEFLAGHSIIQNKNQCVISKKEGLNGY